MMLSRKHACSTPHTRLTRLTRLTCLTCLTFLGNGALAREPGIVAEPFAAEIRSFHTGDQRPLGGSVRAVAVDEADVVYAGTDRGLARRGEHGWELADGFPWGVDQLAIGRRGLLVLSSHTLYRYQAGASERLVEVPIGKPEFGHVLAMAGDDPILIGATSGLYRVRDGSLDPDARLSRLLGADRSVRQIAVGPTGQVAVATLNGLFVLSPPSDWTPLFPRVGTRSWAPHDVRGVCFDGRGRLWFASPQGVGCWDGEQWSLYTGSDGLPYNDFTTITAGEDGVVWFGTRIGAIRFDGRRWSYRQGLRWLPDDHVQAIAATSRGHAWFVTPEGLGVIERRVMTLADKASAFEEAIDTYHRRTPFGYVMSVRLTNPGDTGQWSQTDSDNDGLWTSMYGAGACFAFAATRDPAARRRANAAFEAVRFLSEVTQDGSPPALRGFPARTILPTDGPNPNLGAYTPERDAERQQDDPLWKVIVPRWPTSADGKWYWKCDTSSDELDGHYFLYALYYDLVAQTPEEKQRVRDVVLAITDHLIDHNFELIDHDGKPTRWARFGPEVLNGGLLWPERGLNSLSILSYLKVAEHVSGGAARYREAYQRLIRDHAYATNALDPKLQNGVGSGNQSDDEMAFMCFYNLLKYEQDPQLRTMYNIALRRYWALEQPEACPLFNYIFAASFDGLTAWDVEGYGIPAARVPEACLTDALDTLVRFPLDRIAWEYRNSHRLDIIPLPAHLLDARGRSGRRDGTALPIDERFVEYWNHDPWQVDSAANGTTLADGAAFLLPYYMGLYHGFFVER